MASEPIYKTLDSLAPVEELLAEATVAVNDSSRTSSGSAALNEALAAVGGTGFGGAVGFAGLYFAGKVGLSAAGITSGLAAAGSIVGGGMAVGIAVLAAPALLLGIGGYAVATHLNGKKLIERKEMLLQEALRKQQAVITKLHKTWRHNVDRIDYLERLNTLLQKAVQDLENDLRMQAP